MSNVNLPKTQRGKATLRKLADASEKLLYEKGYHNTTVKDITNEAKVGLGTFYIYFEDKKSMYDYLLMQYSHFIRMHIAMRIKNIKGRKEAEREGLLAFLEIVRSNQHMYNIIWESLYIDKELFVKYYTDFGVYYQRQIINAQNNGEMEKYDPEIIAFVLMGISNFIGLRYVIFNMDTPLDTVVDQVIDIIDRGLFINNKEVTDTDE